MLDHCTLCPLSENLLAGCRPFQTYGSGNILVIASKPSEDESLLNEPCSVEYDFLKKIIPYKFKYTFITRCYGKPTTSDRKTCVQNWLLPELCKVNIALGQEVARFLIDEVKSTTQINNILGKEFLVNDSIVIPNYSVNFVINRNQSIVNKFKEIFSRYEKS